MASALSLIVETLNLKTLKRKTHTMKNLILVASVVLGSLLGYAAFGPVSHASAARQAVSVERTVIAPTIDPSAYGQAYAPVNADTVVNVPEITIVAAPRHVAAPARTAHLDMSDCTMRDSDSTYGGHIAYCGAAR